MAHSEETRRLAASVHLRLSEPLRQALDAEARKRGLSAAGWIRRALASHFRDVAEHGDRQPSPAREPLRVPPEDVAEVARLVGRVGGLAGALVQATKAMRETGAAAHPEAERALAGVRSVQAELVDVAQRLRRVAG